MKHKVQTWATLLENRKLMQKSLFHSGFFWIAFCLSIKIILETLWFISCIYFVDMCFILKISFLSKKWLLISQSYLSKTFYQIVLVILPKRARTFHQKFFFMVLNDYHFPRILFWSLFILNSIWKGCLGWVESVGENSDRKRGVGAREGERGAWGDAVNIYNWK